jgi:hypothetical protein
MGRVAPLLRRALRAEPSALGRSRRDLAAREACRVAEFHARGSGPVQRLTRDEVQETRGFPAPLLWPGPVIADTIQADAARKEELTGLGSSERVPEMTQAAAASILSVPPRECGHTEHHGSCACCQRAQRDRWAAQAAQVTAAVATPLAA